MTLTVFPNSPLPANMSREPFWNSQVQQYDSGVSQGSTPWQRPLYNYQIPFKNMGNANRLLIENFWNARRANTEVFLFGDPYDQIVDGITLVSTGTNPSTAYMYDANSYRVIPASGGVTLTSNLSGTLIQDTDYFIEQDTGIVDMQSLQATSVDFFSVQSTWFFKKVRFDGSFAMQSPLWQQFNGVVRIQEQVI